MMSQILSVPCFPAEPGSPIFMEGIETLVVIKRHIWRVRDQTNLVDLSTELRLISLI